LVGTKTKKIFAATQFSCYVDNDEVIGVMGIQDKAESENDPAVVGFDVTLAETLGYGSLKHGVKAGALVEVSGYFEFR